MIVAEHQDGRTLLLAEELDLKPLLKQNGKWGPATVSIEDMSNFEAIEDVLTGWLILIEATYGFNFLINRETLVEKDEFRRIMRRDASYPEIQMWNALVPPKVRQLLNTSVY